MSGDTSRRAIGADRFQEPVLAEAGLPDPNRARRVTLALHGASRGRRPEQRGLQHRYALPERPWTCRFIGKQVQPNCDCA